jgi:hypothetical protein
MNQEHRALVRRVAGLEVAVVKLQAAMGGIAQSLEAAVATPVECAKCDEFVEVFGDSVCLDPDCPCGLPTTNIAD